MQLRTLLILILMPVLIGGTHVFLYRRLVRDTVRDPRLRRAGAGLLGLLAALLVAGPILQRVAPGRFVTGVLAVGFVWLGIWLLTLSALVTVELARAGTALYRRLRPVPSAAPAAVPVTGEAVLAGLPLPQVDAEPVSQPDRRLFLSRAVAGGALLASGGLGSYGVWRAYQPPEITEVPIRLRGLPKSLDGFSIVQLTDVHVGHLIEEKFLRELVGRANALKPDLVAITGDLVDGSVATLGKTISALTGLKSRYGSWFITGNHEYYSGVDEWVTFLDTIGIPTLRNRHVRIGDSGGSFDLIGVDDWRARDTGRGYDLDMALHGRDPDRAGVLLAHEPANFEVAATKDIGLQISGHTHGGQLFPFTLMVGLEWKYVAGHYREGDSSIYVSRGCGFWGPPMRVAAPPELVKLVLTPA